MLKRGKKGEVVGGECSEFEGESYLSKKKGPPGRNGRQINRVGGVAGSNIDKPFGGGCSKGCLGSAKEPSQLLQGVIYRKILMKKKNIL